MRTSTRRFGFALLELLLVVAVLAVLTGYYFSRGSGSQASRSTYEQSIQKSNDAACAANRAALRTSIEIFRMSNSQTSLTTETLQRAGINLSACPSGATYSIAADGSLICPTHSAQVQPGG